MEWKSAATGLGILTQTGSGLWKVLVSLRAPRSSYVENSIEKNNRGFLVDVIGDTESTLVTASRFKHHHPWQD